MTAPANGREALVKRLQELIARLEYGIFESDDDLLCINDVIALLTAPAEAPVAEWKFVYDTGRWSVVRVEDNFKLMGPMEQFEAIQLTNKMNALSLPQSAPVSREAVIEECAKICDEYALEDVTEEAAAGMECCADRIRSLAAHPAEPGKETGND